MQCVAVGGPEAAVAIGTGANRREMINRAITPDKLADAAAYALRSTRLQPHLSYRRSCLTLSLLRVCEMTLFGGRECGVFILDF